MGKAGSTAWDKLDDVILAYLPSKASDQRGDNENRTGWKDGEIERLLCLQVVCAPICACFVYTPPYTCFPKPGMSRYRFSFACVCMPISACFMCTHLLAPVFTKTIMMVSESQTHAE
jgi:hypothetical protein